MNHLKNIPQRKTWCQLKRLQSLSSSSDKLSIQIPARIKRGPTDILQVLKSTIPHEPNAPRYTYQDDPFLYPLKAKDYRVFALSYEAGKKAAQWIHQEHWDLFPKHLSEPLIKEYEPQQVYKDKSEVSEKILLDAISAYDTLKAVHIYKLLKNDISNTTKQSLLELMCFYNGENSTFNDSPYRRWFSNQDQKLIWQYNPDLNDLYQSLIDDPATAPAAYNAMLCGLARCSRVDQAWLLYHECKAKDVPLNVSTYNYVLYLIAEVLGKKNEKKIQYMLDTLQVMKHKKVKPNNCTLINSLYVISQTSSRNTNLMEHLLMEFKKINIKFSLGVYYMIMRISLQKDSPSHTSFQDIINSVKIKSYPFEHLNDSKFFSQSIYFAKLFNDKEAGDTIHKLLNTEDNRKFICNNEIENFYYNMYVSLCLETSTVDDFFESYRQLVPSVFVPAPGLVKDILNVLNATPPEIVFEHLLGLWSDVNVYCYKDCRLKLQTIQLMKLDLLSVKSPLRMEFINAALNTWADIKGEVERVQSKWTPIETSLMTSLIMMLMQGNMLQEALEALTSVVKQPHFYIPTMTQDEVNELFDTCVKLQFVSAALLVLEYCDNSGFQHIEKMATTLYNLPQITDIDREKLVELVGMESLTPSDSPELK